LDDLQRLLAYEAIRQLVARYAHYADRRDFDALVALFVDDVRVGRDRHGREALRETFETSLRPRRITVLDVGTHVIDLVDDDHATGVVYCRGEVQEGDRWLHQLIAYTDEYERRDGTWYFVRRRHELFYGAEVGVNPLTLPPANWPEHEVGTGTVPQRWDTWQAFTGESPPD
jgi:ketosteroid isomerase-like protein